MKSAEPIGQCFGGDEQRPNRREMAAFGRFDDRARRSGRRRAEAKIDVGASKPQRPDMRFMSSMACDVHGTPVIAKRHPLSVSKAFAFACAIAAAAVHARSAVESSMARSEDIASDERKRFESMPAVLGRFDARA